MELSSSSLVPTRMFGGPLILMSLSEEIDRLILFENWDIVLKKQSYQLRFYHINLGRGERVSHPCYPRI